MPMIFFAKDSRYVKGHNKILFYILLFIYAMSLINLVAGKNRALATNSTLLLCFVGGSIVVHIANMVLMLNGMRAGGISAMFSGFTAAFAVMGSLSRPSTDKEGELLIMTLVLGVMTLWPCFATLSDDTVRYLQVPIASPFSKTLLKLNVALLLLASALAALRAIS